MGNTVHSSFPLRNLAYGAVCGTIRAGYPRQGDVASHLAAVAGFASYSRSFIEPTRSGGGPGLILARCHFVSDFVFSRVILFIQHAK